VLVYLLTFGFIKIVDFSGNTIQNKKEKNILHEPLLSCIRDQQRVLLSMFIEVPDVKILDTSFVLFCICIYCFVVVCFITFIQWLLPVFNGFFPYSMASSRIQCLLPVFNGFFPCSMASSRVQWLLPVFKYS
jgi:hypothetical protein